MALSAVVNFLSNQSLDLGFCKNYYHAIWETKRMAIHQVDADYLIVGAGAMGMAFADAMLAEDPSARLTIVDERARPGGHWNDAYPFVALHQPACWYGVSSESLGRGGSELASGAEVLAYYEQVMRKFLATGRMRYFPMCSYQWHDGSIVSKIDRSHQAHVNVHGRLVDSTYMKVEVPAVRGPKYDVAEGVSLVPPNGLPKVRQPYNRYVVIGAGKTGMDATLFLLEQGVDPNHIHWITPSDAWLYDRGEVQPGRFLDGFVRQMQIATVSKSVEEMFCEFEREGFILRLDEAVLPTKFRCATVSREELDLLRRIKNVVRMGRVVRIDSDEIVLEQGSIPTDGRTLHVDCTADGLAKREVKPVFEDGRITLQSLFMCQQVFSAAIIGHVAIMNKSDEERNALWEVVPHPEFARDYLTCMRASLGNFFRATPSMGLWLRRCRLNFIHHESTLKALLGGWALYRTMGPAFSATERLLEADLRRGESAANQQDQ